MYPWNEWLIADKTVQIVHGDDFHVNVESLMPQIYNAARRHHGHASVKRLRNSDNVDVMEITFHPDQQRRERLAQALTVKVPEEDQPPDLIDDDAITPGQWGPPPTDPRIDFDNLPFTDGRHLKSD
jgi:hypothetical protein